MRASVLLLLTACGRLGFGGVGGDDTPGDADAGLTDAVDDGAPLDGVPLDGPPGPALWAHYPLDDDFDAVGVGRDTSGNDRDLTCTTTQCPARGPGRLGGFAAQFNGTNNVLRYVPMGSEADFTTFTLAAWVRLERRPLTGATESIVTRPTDFTAQKSFALQHNTSGRVQYLSQANTTLLGMGTLPLDSWQHVAISYDGQFKRLYRNGVLEGSASPGAALTYNGRPILVGGDESIFVPTNHLEGQIADVRIYASALTDAQVNALAQ